MSLEPRLQDLVTDWILGVRHDLPDLAATTHDCRERIAELKANLADTERWEGVVRIASPLNPEQRAEFRVNFHDLGVSGLARLEEPGSRSRVLVAIPHHRFSVATPPVLRSELGSLDRPALGNICREVYRLRRGENVSSLIFQVAVGEYTGVSDQLYALQRVAIAAMIPWLTVRDAIAHFAGRRHAQHRAA